MNRLRQLLSAGKRGITAFADTITQVSAAYAPANAADPEERKNNMTKKRFRKLLMATRALDRNKAENICRAMLEILRFNPGTAAFSYFSAFMTIANFGDCNLIDSLYPDGARVRMLHDDSDEGTIVTRTPGYYTPEMELRLVRVFADSVDHFRDKNGNITRR